MGEQAATAVPASSDWAPDYDALPAGWRPLVRRYVTTLETFSGAMGFGVTELSVSDYEGMVRVIASFDRPVAPMVCAALQSTGYKIEQESKGICKNCGATEGVELHVSPDGKGYFCPACRGE